MRRWTILLGTLAMLGTISSACGRHRPESRETDQIDAQAPRQSEGAQTHTQTGVKPGSYEDWCEEHGVPESMCTQCNATLVAAFKATGDWCDEHGLPESQCKQCNPDLKITRPPKPEGT